METWATAYLLFLESFDWGSLGVLHTRLVGPLCELRASGPAELYPLAAVERTDVANEASWAPQSLEEGCLVQDSFVVQRGGTHSTIVEEVHTSKEPDPATSRIGKEIQLDTTAASHVAAGCHHHHSRSARPQAGRHAHAAPPTIRRWGEAVSLSSPGVDRQ